MQGMEEALADSQGVQNYCASLWCVVDHVYDKGGIGVLSFLLLGYAFYRLVWKVWRFAIEKQGSFEPPVSCAMQWSTSARKSR